MADRKTLLSNLLRALVQEWGFEDVDAALARLAGAVGDTVDHGRPTGATTTVRKARNATKLLAIEQVARAQVPEAQAATLRELAARFDRKQILPSVSDVREFLIMMGERPRAMRDRSDAFRQLLKALSTLPPDRLTRLASRALHSGPSELGPLSEAISAVAASVPRHREPNAS